ncbi:hypothetical protein ACTXK0_05210 [Corynebacterium variabile]|uniref:hypothetical protein n=1 Tax=Corynebacterium variabile TaxID=1727 RepID=UPI003FD62D31
MALQWTPHRWDPVVRPGEDMRLTFRLQGAAEKLEAAKVRIAAGEWPLTLSGEGAQLLIPAAEAAQLTDRAPAAVLIRTGGVWTALTTGTVVKEETP